MENVEKVFKDNPGPLASGDPAWAGALDHMIIRGCHGLCPAGAQPHTNTHSLTVGWGGNLKSKSDKLMGQDKDNLIGKAKVTGACEIFEGIDLSLSRVGRCSVTPREAGVHHA